jgi:hypothetical protein
MSTGSFKPLDLQTIMMIPMAKQKQHDEAQSAANEYASLQASSLEQDREAVTGKLEGLRGQANAITATLLDRGVDRNTMAKLNELKRAKEKEFGQQGLIGNAQANYATASAFVKDLTEKKERQAGWSPAEAKKWAQAQVSQFKGTDAGDGKFSSFSGRELEDYVDNTKWINDNIGKVAADTGEIGFGKYKSMGEFETAWRSGTVEEKTATKIIKALALQAQYDHKLQASLKQGSAFQPESDPTNIGSFQIVKKDGVNREVFVPKSRFGMQLLGAATGAAYRKEDFKYTTSTDHAGLALKMKGMEDADLNDLIIATKSGLGNVPATKYESLLSNVALAKSEVEAKRLELKNMGAFLKESGKNPASVAEYRDAVNANNQAEIKYNNLFSSITKIKEKAGIGLNNIQKRREIIGNDAENKASAIIEKMPSLGSSIIGMFTGESPRRDYLTKELSKLGMNREQIDRSMRHIAGLPDSLAQVEIKKEIMYAKGVLFPKHKNDSLSLSTAYDDYVSETNKSSRKVQSYLKDNPAAYNYEILHGDADGKYANFTGRAEEALTDEFNNRGGDGWYDSDSGESLAQFMKEIRDNDPKATFKLSPTPGISLSGEPIEHLQAQDEFGNNIMNGARSTTRGHVGFELQNQIGRTLSKSSMHRELGDKMQKRSMYGSAVVTMGMYQPSFAGGVVPGVEAPDGSLIYIEPQPELSSVNVKRIDKDRYLKSKGKDIRSTHPGDGNPARDTDEVTNIINGIMNLK